MIRGKFFKKMSGGGNRKYVPPALNAQTAYFGFDGSVNGSPNITGTFARTGTAYNPDTGASTATGVPRYVIGKSNQALFIEEGTSNVVLQSNAFDTTWVTTSLTLSKTATDPFGNANNAWVITDSSNSLLEVQQTGLVYAAGVNTFSVFIKKTAGTQTSYPVIYAFAGSKIALATIDTSNGVATAWSAYTGLTVVTSSAKCTSYNDSYWRCSLTYTSDTTNWSVSIFPAATTNATQSTGTVSATVQGTVTIFGAQVEAKAYTTSYIPTTTSAGARNAETFAFNPTGILTAASGTISLWAYVGAYWASSENGFARVFFDHCTTAARINTILLAKSSTAANRYIFQTSNAAGTSSTATADITLATGWHHFVGVWGGTYARPTLFIDGTQSAQAPSNNIAAAIANTCNIGSFSSVQTGGAISQDNTSIDAVRIYSRALAAAEVKQLYTFGR